MKLTALFGLMKNPKANRIGWMMAWKDALPCLSAGEIFDGWGGSRRGRDPEHTPPYVRSHTLAGFRARREKIPAARQSEMTATISIAAG